MRGLIAGDWSEVASIDFAGYVDRDCEERIIYKTPEGALKAAKSFAEGGTVIEDVTREQVVRWILECVVPEEFEQDFRRALPNVAAKGGANLTRLTSREMEIQDAHDLLQNAVEMSAALLDSVAAMLELQVTGKGPLELFPDTASGIRLLAAEQSCNLRNLFGVIVEVERVGIDDRLDLPSLAALTGLSVSKIEKLCRGTSAKGGEA